MKEGWEAKKLVEICKIQYGYPFDSKQFCDDIKYPQLIRIRDVSRGYSETYYSGEIPEGYYVDKGDYLIGMDGEFNIAAWNSERALLNQRVCKILSNEEANDRFLYYNLRIILKQIEDETPFVTVKHLSAKRLNAVTINLPPLSEQQHIVEELDLLSSIIEKKKAQLKELDNLAQSLFYEMFGDIENNTKSFETYKLGEVCNMKAGKAIKADELHDESYNLYPCYGGNGIRGYIDRFSHSGDFPIIGRQGALCGNVNFAMGDFYATEHAVVVTPIIDLNTLWLYYALIAMRLGQYAHGVAQPGLSVKDLNPLSIPIPQLSIQQQFAEKIKAIDNQKELIKQSIKEVETLFNSRMDYYFN